MLLDDPAGKGMLSTGGVLLNSAFVFGAEETLLNRRAANEPPVDAFETLERGTAFTVWFRSREEEFESFTEEVDEERCETLLLRSCVGLRVLLGGRGGKSRSEY